VNRHMTIVVRLRCPCQFQPPLYCGLTSHLPLRRKDGKCLLWVVSGNSCVHVRAKQCAFKIRSPSPLGRETPGAQPPPGADAQRLMRDVRSALPPASSSYEPWSRLSVKQLPDPSQPLSRRLS
jgi:hypothetical protein